MNEIKVTILEFPTAEDWKEVYRRAMLTVGKASFKEPTDSLKEPTDKWKKDILRARHSPIRRLFFSFLLENIPSYVATHLCRHIHAQPYVKSQRNDRQSEYDRNKAPQDAPVNMIWDMGAEELMTIFNKRLCRTADETTRSIIEKIKDEVVNRDSIYEEFAIPMCEYLGKCNEMFPCEKGKKRL